MVGGEGERVEVNWIVAREDLLLPFKASRILKTEIKE